MTTFDTDDQRQLGIDIEAGTDETDETDGMDETDTHALTPVGLWFEACTEHRGAAADGPCAACGWLAEDHTAGLAEVVTVTVAVADRSLRRAS